MIDTTNVFGDTKQSFAGKNKYYIMNGNEKILRISVAVSKLLTVPVVTVFEVYNEIVYDRIIKYYGKLSNFVASRKPVKNREYISQLGSRISQEDINFFLDATYGLSLNDTLWFSPIDTIVTWEDLSLYKHEFNEVIAHFAFTGEGLHGIHLKTTSPEYGTNGMLAKCWHRDSNNVVELIKRGTEGASNTGLEPYSEYYTCQVFKAMGITNYVNYDLIMYKGHLASTCKLFTSEENGFISFYTYTKTEVDIIETYTNLGFREYIEDLLLFDSVVCNHDRHLNNLGFMIDNETLEITEPSPIFDNGYGLSPFFPKHTEEELFAYVDDLGHANYGGFIEMGRFLLNKRLAEKCRALLNFKFEPHPLYNLPEERLDLLSALIRRQAREILK